MLQALRFKDANSPIAPAAEALKSSGPWDIDLAFTSLDTMGPHITPLDKASMSIKDSPVEAAHIERSLTSSSQSLSRSQTKRLHPTHTRLVWKGASGDRGITWLSFTSPVPSTLDSAILSIELTLNFVSCAA
ncbi:hypothetical protein LTR56_001304 [Elasticomyces elasticus]|nr:hypothetical protein LTR56_001304 [Elasticomyces elasticus]KAK3667485.1 hypothetical protein LTR22_001663 [Elasticomyces elasticus]KAK4917037.1 hypothetical protein LTR49_015074 [Elasticomyces elasticus]KAK5762473.1 hypothetical protein LTS12_007450 [Elasticomyces elasticus]